MIDYDKIRRSTWLRKNGNLEDAYEIAVESGDHETIGWALYSLSKQMLQDNNLVKAKEYIYKIYKLNFDEMYHGDNLKKYADLLKKKLNPMFEKMQQLNEMSKQSNMVDNAYRIASEIYNNGEMTIDNHESFGWIIFRFLKHLKQTQNIEFAKAIFLFYLQNINIEKPCLLHSQIFDLLLRFCDEFKKSFNVLEYIDLWGLDNFREEDFSDTYYQDKKSSALIKRFFYVIIDYYPNDEQLKSIMSKINSKYLTLDHIRIPAYWKIYQFKNANNISACIKIFSWYKEHLCGHTASETHTKVMLQAIDFMKESRRQLLIDFYSSWRQCGFSSSDLSKEIDQEKGISYPSKAIRILRAVYSAIKSELINNNEYLQNMYDDYSYVLQYDDNEWGIRDKAFICKQLNKNDEAYQILFQFLKEHQASSYAWKDLAIHGNISDIGLKTALLCKAVNCGDKEDMVVNIHLDLAKALIEENLLSNAKYELNIYENICNTNNWKFKESYKDILDILGNVEPTLNNNDLYIEKIPIAEDILSQDVPWEKFVFVEEYTNKENKRKFIFANNQVSLSINYKKFKDVCTFSAGDVVEIKYEDSVFYKCRNTKEDKWSILNSEYGVINKIDNDKKCMWISAKDDDIYSKEYIGFSKNDIVSFKTFVKNIKDEAKKNAVCIEKNSDKLLSDIFYKESAKINRIDVEDCKFFWESIQSDSYGVVRNVDKNIIKSINIKDEIEVIFSKYKNKNRQIKSNTIDWSHSLRPYTLNNIA